MIAFETIFALSFYVLEMKGVNGMLSKEKIARINELTRKAKEGKLTVEEAKERTLLRKEYLESFRASFRETIENVQVIDMEGNDVTPEKIKQLRRNKLN